MRSGKREAAEPRVDLSEAVLNFSKFHDVQFFFPDEEYSDFPMNFIPPGRFHIEVHPAHWHFPADASWIAGWACPETGVITDLRAWLDHRPFLGLHGLPKPEVEEIHWGHKGPPYAAFSFLIRAHRRAKIFRLEARDSHGCWHEIHRQAITVAPEATDLPKPTSLPARLTELLPALLRLHAQRPDRPLAILADVVVAAALAEPLNSLPVPPFFGALEEPRQIGYVRYGRVSLTGWLAHRTRKITRITAQVDALLDDTLMHGMPRDDIEAVFADLPGRETSSFVGHVDLPRGAASPVLLKVFADLDDGTKHLVFAQRFVPQVIAGADIDHPAVSLSLLLRMVWALVGAGPRLGLPIGPLGPWPSQLKAAWKNWQAEAPAIAPAKRPLKPRPGAMAPTQADAKPLRMLIAIHNLNFEGAPWFIFELARYLGQQPGISIQVVSPQEGPMRRAFEEAGMDVHLVDLRAAFAADSPEAFDRALAEAVQLDWSQVDLVIANTLVSFWAVHLAAAAAKPSLLYVHESTPVRRFFKPLLPPALFPVVEQALTQATHVVFTAEATLRVFPHLDVHGHFRLLPSWVDVARIDDFAAAHEKAVLRRKHGLDPDAVLLVNIGSICERKGQHIYLRAAALLRQELHRTYPGNKIQWVMVGARPGLYLDALKQEANLHGLDNVLFLPETGEIHDFYRLADIFVCTSFEESFPRVLLESAAFRLPIVSTNVNGIAEMLAPDEAWLVSPGDRYQLAEAVKSALVAHFAADTARADRARATIVRRFHEANSLPLHFALARETAARR